MFREILFWDTGTLGCSLSIASVVVVVVVRFVFKSSFKSSGVVCTVLRSRLRCETRSLGKQSCARRVGATRCASRCSGWQGRSAAGVTIPRVSVVKGGRGFALGRRGARGFCSPDVDPRPIDRSRSFPETRPRKLRSRPASRKCLLFFPGEIPGKSPGLSSPPPSAPRSSN